LFDKGQVAENLLERVFVIYSNFFRPEKTELDYDTGILVRLWNVKNVVSAVLSTII
jgi:hypothetical protein